LEVQVLSTALAFLTSKKQLSGKLSVLQFTLNDSDRIAFRFGGQKFSRSLKTNDETSAALARLEDNLRRLELGTLTVELEDDIASFLLSSGQINKRPTAARTETIESLLDQHLANIDL